MRLSRVLAWVLVVVWVVVTVVGVRTASREATYGELVAGLDSGEITEVTVVGDFSTPRTRATVEVQWEDLPVDRYALVDASSSRGEVRLLRRTSPVVRAPVADTLRAEHPDLVVTTATRSAADRGGWTALVGFAAWLWTVLLVITTPGPLRATRWAWFWLIGVLPPVGALGFLLLGGPTGLVPERPGTRRLTGGWAFLLALNSLLATLFGTALAGGLRSLS